MKYLLSILYLFLTYFLIAQEFQKGQIITTENDTIEVLINDDFSKVTSIRSLILKQEEKDELLKLKDKEVLAYQIDSLQYERHKIERPIQILVEQKGFMQVVSKGQVSIYRFDYMVQSQGAKSQKLNNSYIQSDFYLKKEGETEMVLVRKLGFKKTMLEYMKDCPLLVMKIKNKELKFKHLHQIVVYYNKCFEE